MSIQYIGLNQVTGPLIALENVKGVGFEEVASIKLDDGTERIGRVVQMDGDKVILQVFEGTKGLSLTNTRTSFAGKPLEIALSKDILSRIFRLTISGIFIRKNMRILTVNRSILFQELIRETTSEPVFHLSTVL